jgi:hypothetical protein
VKEASSAVDEQSCGSRDRNYSLYIELLKKVLVNSIYCDPHTASWGEAIYAEGMRLEGRDCPRDAHTMVGRKRLDNFQYCIETVIKENIPGDILEAGVWRGGCCILARALLKALGDTSRRVYLADSFMGLPKPDSANYPLDSSLDLSIYPELAVSLSEVQNNFAKYDLLDNQVSFLKGWFKDTLQTNEIEKLAVLRLDGDLYESTIQALDGLYHKLSRGGFVIIDDYGAFEQCRMAVHQFRENRQITTPIVQIDWTGAYWRKE